MLYRIFTEDINQGSIEEIVTKHYPGFTIYKAQGFWRAQKEDSLIIEIITESNDAKISTIATEIKTANSQQAVLVQKIENNQWFV